MQRKSKPSRWDRRSEVLAIVPSEAVAGRPERPWAPMLRDLSRDWRVFCVPAPVRGERLESGKTGVDPVTVDTLPAIRRVLSEHEISTVFLVGGDAVESCLETLHAFASHVPYFVVLDDRWPAEPPTAAPERIEFILGLADRLLLTEPGLRAPLEPLMRRVNVPVDVIPDPRGRAFPGFVESLGGSVRACFAAAQAAPGSEPAPAVIGLVPGSFADAERRLDEWKRCLAGAQERWLIAPEELSAAQMRRLDRRWPGSRWLRAKAGTHAVEQVNRALRAATREFVLLLSGSARVQPLLVERVMACARKLPLVGAVGAHRGPDAPPSDWAQWSSFASAWALRYNGSYRAVPHLREDCFVVRRSSLDAVGLFDSRLDWPLAARDYCLRLRQAGMGLFVAEDALIDAPPQPPRNGVHAAYDQAFVRKWNLDPLSLIQKPAA